MRVTKVKSPKATPAKRPPPPPMLKARRSLPLTSERAAVKRGDAEANAYVLDEQIGYRLRRAHQRASTVFADLMAKYDVTPTQFATLAKLDELGPMSQHQLARVTALEHAEMLAVIGRLQRQTMIRCRPSPLDHRLIEIELTPEAQVAMVAMKDAAAKVSAKVVAPLSPAETKQLIGLLARLG
jgi:MarR family transcriptional regulator, lower aerobic nicotinate degradation pathway regulator